MSHNIDTLVENLQKKIDDDTIAAFGNAGFERWRNPLYKGKLKNPNAYARITGNCGDTMEMFLKFKNGCVQEASYTTDGCGSSTVCGSFAAEMAIGKTPDELADITGEAVLQRIGRFPKEDQHCAFLAANTLLEALGNYLATAGEEK